MNSKNLHNKIKEIVANEIDAICREFKIDKSIYEIVAIDNVHKTAIVRITDKQLNEFLLTAYIDESIEFIESVTIEKIIPKYDDNMKILNAVVKGYALADIIYRFRTVETSILSIDANMKRIVVFANGINDKDKQIQLIYVFKFKHRITDDCIPPINEVITYELR